MVAKGDGGEGSADANSCLRMDKYQGPTGEQRELQSIACDPPEEKHIKKKVYIYILYIYIYISIYIYIYIYIAIDIYG